ncbi:unnamed protein product [Nippostrongylus brasiliensis]|uniref:Zinc finger protein n=1 Tax=Nippostrongylus brasiliensis TaxID=27835 RepID=A0A158QYE8_NIPBR|nr:unnamed protein product [Nippostrongylus brasiliensis]
MDMLNLPGGEEDATHFLQEKGVLPKEKKSLFGHNKKAHAESEPESQVQGIVMLDCYTVEPPVVAQTTAGSNLKSQEGKTTIEPSVCGQIAPRIGFLYIIRQQILLSWIVFEECFAFVSLTSNLRVRAAAAEIQAGL